jgi:hypothetical protein
MAGNKVTLTFAGDADSLAKAAKQAEKSTEGVSDAVSKSSKDMENATKSSSNLGTKLGHLGSATSGAVDAIGTLGDGLQSVIDLEQAGANRASKLARAFLDVQQAQEDLQQALRDGAQAQLDSDQAAIDLEQANQDAAQATKDYADAVKEHGANSLEAKQAQIDLKQAQQDAKQATEDQAQAQRDANQATIDGKTAQQDLNDANREAHPPELQKWADDLQVLTPLLSAVVGVVGLLTAAQWLWNASLWASPVTWIVLAVAALVAIIVIIATKTTWFQDIWNASWGWIKRTAVDVWEWLKKLPGWIGDAFAKIADYIKAPFRAAFNFVADAWNHTIGRLSWSVPSWVPGIGGNTISVPDIPKFHQGGIVPGGLGSETLAVLQAGERVTPMGGGSHAEPLLLGSDGSEFGDFLVDQIRKSVARRGGDVQRVLGSSRG